MKMRKSNAKMGLETRFSVLMDGEQQTKAVDGQSWHGVGRGHEVFHGSYAVCSVPGSSLAFLRAVSMGGQAATRERVVGGHLSRAF